MKALKNIFIFLTVSVSSFGQTVTIDTTFSQSGKTFKVRQKLNSKLLVLSVFTNHVLILVDSLEINGPYIGLDIIDFDGDGKKDLLFQMSSSSSYTFLYLFDETTLSFQKVNGFDNFPEAKAVDGAKNLYYSYHKSGCADSNWDSDLFSINSFKIVHLANVYGQGCKDPMQITVSEIIGGKKNLVENLPYKVAGDNKWNFIANYWAENFRKFIN